MSLPYQIMMVALMVFGFGFVVFFHELGHFLAAKWVGIRVEQFAVGFGQALFAYRKGMGWKVGTTNKELRRRVEAYLSSKEKGESLPKEEVEYTDEQINKAADELGLGETEYRLNWIPLGGYVKMLGQDDLKANAVAEDPRAYNRKGIAQRMLVVSAGVIMNIILAAIGFMVVFLIGLKAPAPIVGSLLSGSPAQKAGLQVGSTILTMDGVVQHDFTKIALNTALLREGADVPIEFELPGNPRVIKRSTIRPERMEPDSKAFLSLGIRQSEDLVGVDPKEVSAEEFKKLEDTTTSLPDRGKIKPGDTIVAIRGTPVKVDEYYLFDRALQGSKGQPVSITVKNNQGVMREELVIPRLERPYGSKSLSFIGMQPRPMVDGLPDLTSVKGKLLPGDVIVAINMIDLQNHPDDKMLKDVANKAYEGGKKLTVYVERDGQTKAIEGIEPKTRIDKNSHGLGIQLGSDILPIASTVLPDSPAKRAGIPDGARIISADGEAVSSWLQFRDVLARAEGSHKIIASVPDPKNPNDYEKEPQTFTVALSASDVQDLKNLRATHELVLHEHSFARKATGPLEAAAWGMSETRDFVLQFYLTLKRMFQGSVSASNMMGPVGIVSAGARFAFKGADWLIWFLAMISANLAVVNFLPIPIVDGGLFTFLVLEKIQGKPLSPKVQAVAQIVGFALIISVFLLVTYQDIRRTMGM